MKVTKVRGIVIKEFETKESDKRLLVMCKSLGRIMVYARGAKKPKSKFLPASQLFAYSDFVLAEGPGFYSVTQADVIKSFYGVRLDYDTLMAAHLFAEICDKSTFSDAGLDELLFLMLKSLSVLTKKSYPVNQVIIVFMLLALNFHGLKPVTDVCTVCGKSAESIGVKMYFAGEGLICPVCALSKKTVKIEPGSLAAVKHILSNPLSDAFRFSVSEKILINLKEVVFFLWNVHFDIKLLSVS